MYSVGSPGWDATHAGSVGVTPRIVNWPVVFRTLLPTMTAVPSLPMTRKISSHPGSIAEVNVTTIGVGTPTGRYPGVGKAAMNPLGQWQTRLLELLSLEELPDDDELLDELESELSEDDESLLDVLESELPDDDESLLDALESELAEDDESLEDPLLELALDAELLDPEDEPRPWPKTMSSICCRISPIDLRSAIALDA
jgi:hypothetical protein